MKNTFLKPVNYKELTAKQQENFNFQKVSALLADYGFMTLRLSSDWESADFIAQHIDRVTFLKVQLKGRFSIDRKYENKDLHICFPVGGEWYLCPHDILLSETLKVTKIGKRPGWKANGVAHSRLPPAEITHFLQQFLLGKIEHG